MYACVRACVVERVGVYDEVSSLFTQPTVVLLLAFFKHNLTVLINDHIRMISVIRVLHCQ